MCRRRSIPLVYYVALWYNAVLFFTTTKRMSLLDVSAVLSVKTGGFPLGFAAPAAASKHADTSRTHPRIDTHSAGGLAKNRWAALPAP